jgi:hypothetical protein
MSLRRREATLSRPSQPVRDGNDRQALVHVTPTPGGALHPAPQAFDGSTDSELETPQAVDKAGDRLLAEDLGPMFEGIGKTGGPKVVRVGW